eukprot:TRINITY_DN764_c0_g1_i1.p1 TRINITY_DN764_c0_g1~~TRINITY_DN764_c0_g1_i1.p1  ORF type:complete len:444 (+),score=172.46 TRINITY_DN764_c0_g1_i1:103-1434(+)
MAERLLEKDLIEISVHQFPNENVLSKIISWDVLQTATIIQARELDLMKRYDKQSLSEKQQLFSNFAEDYALLFLKIVNTTTRDDILQYTVFLIDEILTIDENIANVFLNLTPKFNNYPFHPLFRLITRDDSSFITSSKACKIIALLMTKAVNVPNEFPTILFQWVINQLSSKQNIIELSESLSILQQMLRCDPFRFTFYSLNGYQNFRNLIKTQGGNFQLQYQILHCIWLLTYNNSIADNFHSTDLMRLIVDLLKVTTKEKVIRMGVATFKNIIGKPLNNEQMIELGLLKIVTNLLQKKWGDEDITLDLEAITESLQLNINLLNSFDMYKQEILSGKLEWTSPCHTSDKFWRDSAMRFEENNFRILVVLVDLLQNSNDTTVLSIAAHDIGEFVRCHPRGRMIIQQLKAKEELMRLMTHSDPEVQKHALLSVQKIMVQNWEHLR